MMMQVDIVLEEINPKGFEGLSCSLWSVVMRVHPCLLQLREYFLGNKSIIFALIKATSFGIH